MMANGNYKENGFNSSMTQEILAKDIDEYVQRVTSRPEGDPLESFIRLDDHIFRQIVEECDRLRHQKELGDQTK